MGADGSASGAVGTAATETSLSLISAFVSVYADEGLVAGLTKVVRVMGELALPLAELALLSTIMAVLFAAMRSMNAKKHDVVLKGIANKEREPPRDIMAPHFFQNKQGLWLHHGLYWDDKTGVEAKGVVVLLHGHSEHHRRFLHVADKFNEQGFVVFGMDHQGFGRSEGDRGHVESFDHYPEDVMDFMKQVVYNRYPKWRELPRFLVAHSMGGLIAIHTVMRCKTSTDPAHKLSGAVLSAPALNVDPSRNTPVVRFLGRVVDMLFPKAQLVSFPSYPSTKFFQLKLHATMDPLNYQGAVRVHQGLELVRGTAEAIEHAPSFDLPVLIFHGSEDLHVDVTGSKQFVSVISSEDKLLVELPGLHHEPWQEEESVRGPILDAAVAWAAERLPGNNKNLFENALGKLTMEFIKHPSNSSATDSSGSESGFEKL